MLNRGSRGGRFRPGLPRIGSSRPEGFPSEPRQEEFFEESGVVPRRLPASPIYTGSGPYDRKIPKPQAPKLLRDQLYDRMCDWDFHGLADFEKWMDDHQWITAMCDLVSRGFTFDRRGEALRLRKRNFNEKKPSIVALLSGLTVPIPEQFYPPAELNEPDELEGGSVQSFEFGQADEQPEPGDEMRLGIDDQLVLSAPSMLTETVGILARKGAGKTYLAMVMAEEFLASRHNMPVVVLDPMGAWWGLGTTSDGSPAPKHVVVFGGEHGHFPLKHTSGKKMARLVIDLRPLSMVFDLSKMEIPEQHEFGADFATELYQKNRDPMHLFIDEADVFVPQKLDKGDAHHGRSLNIMSTLVLRGRLRGIGETMITQRPARINKDVLTQVGAVFFMRMNAPHDQDAARRWMDSNNLPKSAIEACVKDLPGFGRGSAYFILGGESSRFCKFNVRLKATYDSSSTPDIKKPRKPAPILVLPDPLLAMVKVGLAKAEKVDPGVEDTQGEEDGEALSEDPGMDLAVLRREFPGQGRLSPSRLPLEAESESMSEDEVEEEEGEDREPEFDTLLDEER